MKKWLVSLPMTGKVTVEVKAETAEAAIEEALDSELSFNDIEEWDVHREVDRGNVYRGPIGRASAEEMEDDDDTTTKG